MFKKRVSWGTAIILMLMAAAVAVSITIFVCMENLNSQLASQSDREKAFAKFSEVEAYVRNNFVGEYDPDVALDQAMKGYIAGLGDKWSSYLTAEEFQTLKASLNNQYTGLGVSVIYDEEEGVLIITQVHADSAAEDDGIEIGDKIVEVEGLQVKDVGYSAIVDKIKGEAGTFVSLVIEDSRGQKRELSLERRLTTQEVVSTRMLENQIGYVRIENFDTGADKEFTDKVQNLLEAGAKALVFDVRNNNGGIDTVMSSILDELLPQGLIISIRDKEGNEKYAPQSDAEEISLPMAVVVNRYSYSAAEFFAAALQEYDKAVVVGEATTGKGYAQSTIPLTDGSGLYLSTNTYFTPSGKSLADVGITPDVECLLPDDVAADTTGLDPAADKQIAEAIRVVMEGLAVPSEEPAA